MRRIVSTTILLASISAGLPTAALADSNSLYLISNGGLILVGAFPDQPACVAAGRAATTASSPSPGSITVTLVCVPTPAPSKKE